jgi:hypothetical protein
VTCLLAFEFDQNSDALQFPKSPDLKARRFASVNSLFWSAISNHLSPMAYGMRLAWVAAAAPGYTTDVRRPALVPAKQRSELAFWNGRLSSYFLWRRLIHAQGCAHSRRLHPAGAARPALMDRGPSGPLRRASRPKPKAAVRIEMRRRPRPRPCLGCAVELVFVLRIAPLRRGVLRTPPARR